MDFHSNSCIISEKTHECSWEAYRNKNENQHNCFGISSSSYFRVKIFWIVNARGFDQRLYDIWFKFKIGLFPKGLIQIQGKPPLEILISRRSDTSNLVNFEILAKANKSARCHTGNFDAKGSDIYRIGYAPMGYQRIYIPSQDRENEAKSLFLN